MGSKKSSKRIKIKLLAITILILLTTILGISYAYFSVQVTGNEEASSITVITAKLSLIYTDLQIMSGDELYPGWTQTKTITVENNGTVSVNYDIFWREILNEVIDDELVISATCTSTHGTCDDIAEMPIGTYLSETKNVVIQSRIPINPGEKHTYQVTVEFKELGSDQGYNQGKQFYGTLNIGEGAETHPLYDKIKLLAEDGTYADDYSGNSSDTFGQVGNKTIYYIKPKTEDDADELLDMINVKFAGFCWQMFRTTDTGGVKLIYNGDPDPTTGYCQSPTVQ